MSLLQHQYKVDLQVLNDNENRFLFDKSQCNVSEQVLYLD